MKLPVHMPPYIGVAIMSDGFSLLIVTVSNVILFFPLLVVVVAVSF
jgi:hypothetical protein